MIKAGFCFYKDNYITRGDPEFSFDFVAFAVPVKHRGANSKILELLSEVWLRGQIRLFL